MNSLIGINKKAMETRAFGLVISLVLASFIVWFIFTRIFGGSEDAIRPAKSLIMTQKNQFCEIRGQTEEISPEGDKDNDEFPDSCDICIGGDNKNRDSNDLGIPDDCYVKPTKVNKINSYEDMCIEAGGCFIKDGRCCKKREICRAEC